MTEQLPNIINCKDFHDDCFKLCTNKFVAAVKYTLKIYGIAHGIPLLIFKLKQLRARPVETLTKYCDNVLRSMGFLGTYIMSMRIFHCYIYSGLLGRFNCKKLTNIYIVLY